jgi:hypothetical protein
MGYYTNYDVKITGIDNANQAVKIAREYELEHYDISPIGTEITASFESKWYDWQKDSVALSRNYPQILIEINGLGEDHDDIWKARIRNGDCETVSANIVYEDFKRIL